jgi:hypothetical protein
MSIEETIKRMFPVDDNDLKQAVTNLQSELPLTSRQALAVRRAFMSYEAAAQESEGVMQTICDLASARLNNIDAVRSEVDFTNLEHDLKEIVRLTGKTWR